MMKPDQGQYLNVEGIKTFYVRAGTGTPLLLIHEGAPGACSLVNWGLSR